MNEQLTPYKAEIKRLKTLLAQVDLFLRQEGKRVSFGPDLPESERKLGFQLKDVGDDYTIALRIAVSDAIGRYRHVRDGIEQENEIKRLTC